MRFLSDVTLAAANRASGGFMSLSTSTMNEKDLDIDGKRATPVLSHFTGIRYDAVGKDRLRIFSHRFRNPLDIGRRDSRRSGAYESGVSRRASIKSHKFCP